ncbi:class A beta-lactamase [Methylobacterium fujisawaense]|uniref:class A beta-lactamase n=1 Tax=Methylobacterium fujisawaense TaxID=107400 RepID=UPI002F34B917
MLTRRQVAASAAGVLFTTFASKLRSARADGEWSAKVNRSLALIEARSQGRLGVVVLDKATGNLVAHRSDERFPMCSTFKTLAAAAVLARVDRGEERLTRRVRFTGDVVVVNSPVTEHRAGGDGMTLSELCDAAITMSDNTAGNLLLAAIGGPEGLTRYVRTLGDPITRLDRLEPDLNEAQPGDARDTTSPAAMVANLDKLLFSDALSSSSRDQLSAWLIGNKTGDTRLRAGLPRTWRVGDKTGSGERGTTNDAGIVWPPGRKPLILAIYLTGAASTAEGRNATLASVGRAVAETMEP